MAVLRKNKTSNFTVIDNNIFKNRKLSLKARGLLCTMLSLPDNWEYSLNGLCAILPDGITTIRSALKELAEHKYFDRYREYENGKLAGVVYIVSETPMQESLVLENLKQENLKQENRTQYNTYTDKEKNKSNTDIGVIADIVDYLNRKAGTHYRHSTKETQKLITARLQDFTVEDFKKVIDKKVSQWRGTTMEQFLRPQTLFGTKFESYLNQNIVNEEKTKHNQPEPPRYPEFEKEEKIDTCQMPDKIREKYGNYIDGLNV